MLVYMLLNVVTELAYVGQTNHSLHARVREHWAAAKSGSPSRIHEAMRDWDDPCFWEAVVLQICYDQRQLDLAEAVWQASTNVLLGGVGYNSRRENVDDKLTASSPLSSKRTGSPVMGLSEDEAREWYREQGRKGGDPITAKVKSGSPLAGLTPEQRREFFREAGKRGAAKARETR